MFVFATLIESLVVFKLSRYDDAVKENEEKRTNIIEEVVGYKPNNAMKVSHFVSTSRCRSHTAKYRAGECEGYDTPHFLVNWSVKRESVGNARLLSVKTVDITGYWENRVI